MVPWIKADITDNYIEFIFKCEQYQNRNIANFFRYCITRKLECIDTWRYDLLTDGTGVFRGVHSGWLHTHPGHRFRVHLSLRPPQRTHHHHPYGHHEPRPG